jgi:hypothetical protein
MTIKGFFDWAAITTTVASLIQWAPAAAGVVSLIWVCYRVYETHLSVQLLKKQLAKD